MTTQTASSDIQAAELQNPSEQEYTKTLQILSHLKEKISAFKQIIKSRRAILILFAGLATLTSCTKKEKIPSEEIIPDAVLVNTDFDFKKLYRFRVDSTGVHKPITDPLSSIAYSTGNVGTVGTKTPSENAEVIKLIRDSSIFIPNLRDYSGDFSADTLTGKMFQDPIAKRIDTMAIDETNNKKIRFTLEIKVLDEDKQKDTIPANDTITLKLPYDCIGILNHVKVIDHEGKEKLLSANQVGSIDSYKKVTNVNTKDNTNSMEGIHKYFKNQIIKTTPADTAHFDGTTRLVFVPDNTELENIMPILKRNSIISVK